MSRQKSGRNISGVYICSISPYLYGVSATSWRKHKNVNFHTEGRSEEKPLLPQMMCFVWLRVSQGIRDAHDDSLSRLPTRPEIDDNDYVQSFVACCLFSFSFSFFFCRKIKNIPGNLLRLLLLLLLLQSSPCGTSEQIYLSQYDGATTMKTALAEGSSSPHSSKYRSLLAAPPPAWPAI